VELLVVIMILATVGALTTGSVDSLQSKHRVNETVKSGRAIIETLEKSDGLSFVSDFGRLPIKKSDGTWSWNEDELKLIYLQDYKKSDNSDFKANTYDLFDLKGAAQKLTGIDNQVVNCDELKGQKLGGGWRGPYCSFRPGEIVEGSDVNDSWGNSWELSSKVTDLSDMNENLSIVSLGRDGLKEEEAGAKKGWQDRDLIFSLRKNFIYNAELNVSVEVGDSLALTDVGFIYFSPFSTYSASEIKVELVAVFDEYSMSSSNWKNTVTSQPNFSISVNGNSTSFTLQGLYVGRRSLLVYGKKSEGGYAFGALQNLNIRPGTNYVSVKLRD